jgi:hypothetical protein
MINQMLLEQLQRNVHSFIRTIRTLSAEQFLTKMNGWAPRDVTAHLIGWNRATLEGVDAIRRGELPASLVDPGEDFSKINASFVAQYDSTDAQQLLRELELSFQELARHCYTLDLADWTTDFGVLLDGGASLTVDKWVGALSEDFYNHRREIEAWRNTAAVRTD